MTKYLHVTSCADISAAIEKIKRDAMTVKPTGRNAPRPRREAPATTSRTVSWTREANDAVEAYAAQHGMSRSAAASQLVLYGTAWAQERAKKRGKP